MDIFCVQPFTKSMTMRKGVQHFVNKIKMFVSGSDYFLPNQPPIGILLDKQRRILSSNSVDSLFSIFSSFDSKIKYLLI